MSYTITINGHGPDGDELKEIFSDTVRQLRALDSTTGNLSGQVSGSDGQGNSFPSLNAADVKDEPAEAIDDIAPDDDEDGS